MRWLEKLREFVAEIKAKEADVIEHGSAPPYMLFFTDPSIRDGNTPLAVLSMVHGLHGPRRSPKLTHLRSVRVLDGRSAS